jgi:carboxypeptidase C (cathepsin A)
VDSHVPPVFSSCNNPLNAAFHAADDSLRMATEHVAGLLERGVRVLIYVGTYDWICNWIGNERWTLALEWSGQEEFASKALHTWEVDGKVAGKSRSAGKFTFATINAAGHMVRLFASAYFAI